jgi:hypothetical protein
MFAAMSGRTRSAFAVALLAMPLRPHAPPAIPDADRIRIAEAFRLAAAVQDSIWPQWSRAPFALLLVTADREFLVRHPAPSPDFSRIGHDSLLDADVFSRPRQLSPALLATYPAVGGVPTIVIGRAEATGKTSSEWVLTVLHEHFHQLQTSQPGYYAGVAALNLSRGDQSGMWMLNYPFPYDSAPVQQRFSDLTRTLTAALDAADAGGVEGAVAAHRRAGAALRAALSADDYRYLEFQFWQEGVARYTELRVAELAARTYTPSAGFTALSDFTPFSTLARAARTDVLNELRHASLGQSGRVAFYSVGATTALLLDSVAPGWQRRYFTDMFVLDRYFTGR